MAVRRLAYMVRGWPISLSNLYPLLTMMDERSRISGLRDRSIQRFNA
jgi:hypothetical protein